MKRSNLFRIALATALLFSALSSSVLITSVAAAPIGCFFFTDDGVRVGATHCNVKANDITVDFLAGTTTCVLASGMGMTEQCPKLANNLEVAWGMLSGVTVILGCHWTEGGRIIANCPLEGSTKFTFETPIKKVIWTFGGADLPHPVKGNIGGENGLQFSI
ncbi:MAG: hypothetical protein ACHQ1H_10570 [Nitrososphaerales archaeon]